VFVTPNSLEIFQYKDELSPRRGVSWEQEDLAKVSSSRANSWKLAKGIEERPMVTLECTLQQLLVRKQIQPLKKRKNYVKHAMFLSLTAS